MDGVVLLVIVAAAVVFAAGAVAGSALHRAEIHRLQSLLRMTDQDY